MGPQRISRAEFERRLKKAGYSQYIIDYGATIVAYITDENGNNIELFPDDGEGLKERIMDTPTPDQRPPLLITVGEIADCDYVDWKTGEVLAEQGETISLQAARLIAKYGARSES